MSKITDIRLTCTYQGVDGVRLITYRRAAQMANCSKQNVSRLVIKHRLESVQLDGLAQTKLLIQHQWEGLINDSQ